MRRITLGTPLTTEDLLAVARGESVKLVFGREAQSRVKSARALVEKMVKAGKPVYGVNTGFGLLASEQIDAADVGQLQKNLLMRRDLME